VDYKRQTVIDISISKFWFLLVLDSDFIYSLLDILTRLFWIYK